MAMIAESEIRHNRNIALLLQDEARTDRLENIIRDLIIELGMDITDQHFKGCLLYTSPSPRDS